jgi:hypothetical protein
MGDTKKIAVIVRDRQSEALRVSGGLTLADDTVDVFIPDGKLDRNDPAIVQPLELVSDLDLKVYTATPDSGFTTLGIEDMAKKLLEYDIIVPY